MAQETVAEQVRQARILAAKFKYSGGPEGRLAAWIVWLNDTLESRDAEVAELKAKIAAAVARLNAASIPPMMTEAQFNATTITDARRILLGSASSPVEGGN